MALTTIGYAGTVSTAEWARFHRHHDDAGYRHAVTSGFAVTPGSGLTVSVASGTAVLPGLLVDSDAATSVTLNSNAGTTNRTDYVVLQAAWGTPGTTTLTVVQGVSATAPALTQTEGITWQMPLARVTVRPGATTFTATDIVTAKPLPRRAYPFKANVEAKQIGYATSGVTVATQAIPDPGWPYTLAIQSTVRLSGTAGYAVAKLTVNGATVGRGFSGLFTNNSGRDQVTALGASEVLTGPATVELTMSQDAGVNGNPQDTIAGAASTVYIQQIPA